MMEEEAKKEAEGKEKQDAASGKLLSRVQELEDELKNSEHKGIVLSHDNVALQMQLKASQEEEGRIRQELAGLKERWRRSQVRRMVLCATRQMIKSAVCHPSIPYCSWSSLSHPTHLPPWKVR